MNKSHCRDMRRQRVCLSFDHAGDTQWGGAWFRGFAVCCADRHLQGGRRQVGSHSESRLLPWALREASDGQLFGRVLVLPA